MVQYPLTFRAAILEQNNQPLKVDIVTFGGPLEIGQVLVRIHYSGICGKQIEEIRGTGKPDPYLPHMLGHEGSGVIVDIGPGVRKVKSGDKVVAQWVKGSGIDSLTPIYTRKSQRINAGWITTFNEYAVLSENRVTKIPDDSDLLSACLLGCAVTTGVGVIINEANVRPGESVAIVGCGGVGLNAIQGAVLVNAAPIIAIDNNKDSLKRAKDFGATHFIDSSSQDVIHELRKINAGANYVIITATNAKIMETAVQLGSFPGSVFFVGVPNVGTKINVNALDLHRRLMLTGSFGGGCVPDRDIPKYLALNKNNKLKLKELISSILPLEDINKGTKEMSMGKSGRIVVDMTKDV